MNGQKYTSQHLFHFVGRSEPDDQAKFDLLTKILRDEQLRHPPFGKHSSKYGYTSVLEDGEWVGSVVTERQGRCGDHPLFDNIVCFADIPFESLALHMSKYSQFGLAFDKAYLAERGVRPVMYFPHWKSTPGLSIHGIGGAERIDSLLKRLFQKEFDDDNALKRTVLLDLMAFIKAFDVNKPEDDIDNYYMEREWRAVGYVPFALSDIEQVLLPERYHYGFSQRFPSLATRIAKSD